MNNEEQNDDLSRSITGGTLVFVLFTIIILVAYATLGREYDNDGSQRDARSLHARRD